VVTVTVTVEGAGQVEPLPLPGPPVVVGPTTTPLECGLVAPPVPVEPP